MHSFTILITQVHLINDYSDNRTWTRSLCNTELSRPSTEALIHSHYTPHQDPFAPSLPL